MTRSLARGALIATFSLALLAPSALSAKDRTGCLVDLAGNVERKTLHEIDLSAANASLVEAGRKIRPDKAAEFDTCIARKDARSLADTAAAVFACAGVAKLPTSERAAREDEFGRLLVSFSGFPQDKFFDAAEIERLLKLTSPSTGVIGLGLIVKDEKIAVALSYAGGPARERGIGPGWQLLTIDGAAYSPAEIDKAVAALRGDIGSTASLGLIDPMGARREVSLTRVAVDRIDSDMEYQWSGDTLTVQIHGMDRGVSHKVEALFTGASREPSQIVLDLRSNTGGVLDEAILLADLFLDRGRIAAVRGRQGANTVYDASRGAIAPNAKITVLVDHETAAGAELLAAALADNARATVRGEATRGNGTIRSFFSCERHPAALVTTQEILRPNGEPIEGRGIQPAGSS